MEGRRAVISGGDMTSGRESVRREWNETLWERNILDILAIKYRKQKAVLLGGNYRRAQHVIFAKRVLDS